MSCCITAILSVWVAVPLGYLLSRHRFPGKWLVDALLDIPIVLPPLVIGLSLLILFQTLPGRAIQRVVPITYAIPSVILAQFAVACAFAVRTMRVSFDQIPVRREQVALTLGCSRSQAFWWVVLPEAWRGVVTAATLSWARALGEFGPILIFSGATRMRTEVLPTTVFLELSVGNLNAAVAVSLLMVAVAAAVLVVVRFGASSARGCPKFLGLDHLLERVPADLSAGESQRVALGRPLASYQCFAVGRPNSITPLTTSAVRSIP